MARIRTIKPGFFTSEDVSDLPLRARLTWIGLWTHCDDQGRAKDNVKLIKAAVWVLDEVSLRDVEEDLCILAQKGRITRYEKDGGKYLAVTNWRRHQRIDKPTPSVFPDPPPRHHDPIPERSRRTPGVVLDDSQGEGKGREGRGGDARASARPAPTCARHRNGTDQPCGACGVARRAHDSWEPRTPIPLNLSDLNTAERCTDHGEIVGQCALCRRDMARSEAS